MADEEEERDSSHRPSFASFWKRSKEAVTGKKITFVPGNGPGPGDPSPSSSSIAPSASDDAGPSTGQDKKLLRRAQVRKAQIQHRERKANYVRQLELDVSDLREKISVTDEERRALREENVSIRTRLATTPSPVLLTASVAPSGSLFGDIDLDQFTLTLGVDDELGLPVYQLSPSPASSQSLIQAPQTQGPHSQGLGNRISERSMLPQMTPAQTQGAINFILSLEHICWDHFHPADFVASTEPTGAESGHALMATAVALQHAPESVFEAFPQIRQSIQGHQGGHQASPPVHNEISWQASGLTLQSLYGLAHSLIESDQELAPVQAWFELASQYPPDMLLRSDILAALRRELEGLVTCPHYGAAIERGAFESVVSRILGPPPTAQEPEESQT